MKSPSDGKGILFSIHRYDLGLYFLPYQQHGINNSNVIPGGLALGLEQVGRGIVIECKDSGREFKEQLEVNLMQDITLKAAQANPVDALRTE